MAELKRLPRLEELGLYGTILTESGWAHLAAVRNLRHLELRGVEAPDGWEHMRGLTQVQSLAVHTTPDTDLAAVGSLRNLQELSLDFPLTDQQIAHLERLANLRVLSLGGLEDGPAALRRLTGLRELELSFGVRDSWLALIEEMKGLKKIVLDRYSGTPSQIEALRSARPDLEVVFEEPGGGGLGGGGGGAL